MSAAIFLLLIFLFLAQRQPASSSSPSNGLVTDICAHSSDPAYCTDVFDTDARTPGADLTALGHISIDHGLVLATTNSNLIILKNSTAKDETVKSALGVCFGLYDGAKDALVAASDALDSGNFGSMNINGHYAQQAGLDCENSSPSPSPLQAENRHFVVLTHAVVVISNMLVQKQGPA